jgi:DNA-binding LacI/PurR family transcriptional regulator
VPDDVAIVGFDDIERGEYAAVSLSTVRQPTTSIGKEAVNLLLRLMQGKKPTIRRVLKTELVVRESSGKKKNGHVRHRAAGDIVRQRV